MRSVIITAALALLTVLLADCGGTAIKEPPKEKLPKILIISSLIGYVEPCGCTADLLLGGIARITTMIEEARSEGPVAVVLVGPYLFEKVVEAHRIPQEKAKAELIAKAIHEMGVDVVVNTEAEMIQGAELLSALQRNYPIPDVALTKTGGQGRILTLGTSKVGVFGLTGSTDAGASAEVIGSEVKRLRQQGAHVVLGLANRPAAEIRSLSITHAGVDAWVLSDHPRERKWMSPMKNGYLIEAGDRGRNLGQLTIHGAQRPGPFTDPQGDVERARQQILSRIEFQRTMMARTGIGGMGSTIKNLEAQLVALPPAQAQPKRIDFELRPVLKSVQPNPKVKAWLDAYNEKLISINLAHAGEVAPVPEGASGYSGIAECQDCHEDAVEFWRKTAHARAWKTLVDGKKTFDAECVGCHVTGWQAPGGTILGQTKGLEDVQCEVCHGPASEHVESGGDTELVKRNAGPEVCTQCHNKHHSPAFDYGTYRPRILGPGHGAPMP